MVAINFKKQFADLVERGEKRQTIREKTKASAGKMLQLYYGQRTKQCRKLMDAVCSRTRQIVLRSNQVVVGLCDIRDDDLDKFAKADGFKNYNEMWKFFEPRSDQLGEFHGWLIEW
jgi:hypothetical protein